MYQLSMRMMRCDVVYQLSMNMVFLSPGLLRTCTSNTIAFVLAVIFRTKDLIDVVVQLNAKEGFMAVSTFHSETLQVYPIIFVDPQKVTSSHVVKNPRSS